MLNLPYEQPCDKKRKKKILRICEMGGGDTSEDKRPHLISSSFDPGIDKHVITRKLLGPAPMQWG